METVIQFPATASKVEERFIRSYNKEKLATAKAENQIEYDMISTGWWVLVDVLGISISLGKDKPALNVGDKLMVRITKL